MQVKSQKLRKQLKLTTKASILISWLRGLLEKPKRAEHKMRLIVGLGNPGEVYQYNRHNIGFMVIDSLVDKYDLSPAKSQFNGLVYTGRINDNKVILLKPSTFMNKSGRSVRAAMNFYKISIDNIIVFHDELDLIPGKVRVKIGGGISGHNGLRSIRDNCGAEFKRIRLGIGHPGHKDRVHKYVLSNFNKSEEDLKNSICFGAAKYTDLLIGNEFELFQTRINEYIKG